MRVVNRSRTPHATPSGSRLADHGSRLVLASGNAGKLAELRELFAGTGIELVAQHELGITAADETARTFVENALLKARHAARCSGLPALGDDSGLCVDALRGAPGLFSARYAGEHGNASANNERLLRELVNVPDGRRTARFVCVLALLTSVDDPDPLVAEGRWPGTILHEPRGDRGFGYDPVFRPDDGDGRSAAELDPATKNRSSHRGQAMARLQELLAMDGRRWARR